MYLYTALQLPLLQWRTLNYYRSSWWWLGRASLLCIYQQDLLAFLERFHTDLLLGQVSYKQKSDIYVLQVWKNTGEMSNQLRQCQHVMMMIAGMTVLIIVTFNWVLDAHNHSNVLLTQLHVHDIVHVCSYNRRLVLIHACTYTASSLTKFNVIILISFSPLITIKLAFVCSTVNLQTFATAGLQSSATTVYISNHRVHAVLPGLRINPHFADIW